MTTTLPGTVTFTDLDGYWMRALEWAVYHPTTVRLLGTEVINHEVTAHYDVDSWSRPGLKHRTVCQVDGEGIHVSCGCERMTYRSQPCRHGALVLLQAGWLEPSQLVRSPKRLKDLLDDD